MCHESADIDELCVFVFYYIMEHCDLSLSVLKSALLSASSYRYALFFSRYLTCKCLLLQCWIMTELRNVRLLKECEEDTICDTNCIILL